MATRGVGVASWRLFFSSYGAILFTLAAPTVDAACMPAPAMTQHAAPRADVSAAAITAANAVCFFSELTTVPHILEPSTTPSGRTGDMPTREALEPKVNVSSCQPRPLPQTPPRGPWVPTCSTMWKRSASPRERYANAQSALPPSPN